MSECQKLTGYLDRRLLEPARTDFINHAQSCPHCSQKLAGWSQFEQSLKAWTDSTEQPAPTQGEAYSLVGRVSSRRNHNGITSRGLVIGTLAASLVLGFALMALWQTGPGESPTESNRRVPVAATSPHTFFLDSTDLPRLLKTVGDDKVGLGPGSIVRVVDKGANNIELNLLKGSVATQVAKRREGQSFKLMAGPYTIEVLGTRFLTTVDDNQQLSVVVLEGQVRVSESSGRQWLLTAGQSLKIAPNDDAETQTAPASRLKELNALLDESSAQGEVAGQTKHQPKRSRKTKAATSEKAIPKTVADYETWRKRILQGQSKSVAADISIYLKVHKSDSKAWSLLADSQRKMSDWSGAVSSYKRAIKTGGLSTANRARYMAASILQKELGNHPEAIVLLREYLAATKRPSDLSEMAKVQLARSLIATGQPSSAKVLLEEVIADQESDSILSKNATRLLSQIN